MVSELGEECYIEVPYPENACSAFVREVVIPLLGKDPNAQCSKEDLKNRILNWLKIVRPSNNNIEICFDYQGDWDLFVDSIDGEIPTFVKPRNISNNVRELLFEQFFEKNIGTYFQHHSLHDSKANAYAFRQRPMSLTEVMTGIPSNL